MTCESCGKEVAIGEWPFCPHGETRFSVDHFSPYFDENISPDGMMISSARQRRKYMDANGIDFHSNKFKERIARGSTGKQLLFDMGRR